MDLVALKQAAELLVIGWGGIFVVMAVLYVAIKILLYFDRRDLEKKEESKSS